MSAVLSFLFSILAMFVVSLILRHDPNKWYGEMECWSCGYQWNSRRNTPPARCPSCGSREIHIVTEASKNNRANIQETEIPQHRHETNETVLQDYTPKMEKDPLYAEAVRLVLTTHRASPSAVQRHLRIGYNHAYRYIETMEKEGIISPMKTNGTREVLISSIQKK